MAEETKEKTANQFRLSEIETHKSAKSLWVVIHNKVYDVTKFIDEHPGGEEVLIEQGGKNATENFEDVGHSTDARELMKNYYIGDLAEEDRPEKDFPVKSAYTESEPPEKFSFTKWLLPAVIAFTVAMLYRYYVHSGK